MTSNASIPAALDGMLFFTTSVALRSGMSRYAISQLDHPHHGVVGRRMPMTILEDAQALALVLPSDCVFTHWSAAWLLGLGMPTRWTASPRPRLDVGRHGGTPPRHRTVRVHRLSSFDIPTVVVQGLDRRVIAPEHLFRQLADSMSHTDLVVLGDAICSWKSNRSVEDLDSGLSIRSPGLVAARSARAEVRAGTNSVMESRLRQDFAREGLPEPELNAPIADGAGRVLAYADFLWRAERLVVEYNGAHHFASAEQRVADESRRNLLERMGYRVIIVNKTDYFQHHADTMRAVREALADQRARVSA